MSPKCVQHRKRAYHKRKSRWGENTHTPRLSCGVPWSALRFFTWFYERPTTILSTVQKSISSKFAGYAQNMTHRLRGRANLRKDLANGGDSRRADSIRASVIRVALCSNSDTWTLKNATKYGRHTDLGLKLCMPGISHAPVGYEKAGVQLNMVLS